MTELQLNEVIVLKPVDRIPTDGEMGLSDVSW